MVLIRAAFILIVRPCGINSAAVSMGIMKISFTEFSVKHITTKQSKKMVMWCYNKIIIYLSLESSKESNNRMRSVN
jgi:hypothetical protein